MRFDQRLTVSWTSPGQPDHKIWTATNSKNLQIFKLFFQTIRALTNPNKIGEIIITLSTNIPEELVQCEFRFSFKVHAKFMRNLCELRKYFH